MPQVLDQAAAISLARPRHLLTLTQVGPRWDAVKRAMGAFLRSLRGSVAPVEAVYHVEANPGGTGNHMHVWVRSSRLPRRAVAPAVACAGFGTTFDVRPVLLPPEGQRLPATTYGMKACLQRPAGATGLWPAAEEYLTLNGDRLEHHTRDFHLDRAGVPAGGVRLAIREARQQYGLSGGWTTA